VQLIVISIVSITPPIAASTIPPYFIATPKVFLKYGALEERSYYEIIWLQILKKLERERMQSGSFAVARRGATCFGA
jgi:hypothetical protein